MRVSNSDFRPPVHALYFNYLTFTHSSLMQFLVFITLAGTPATIECEGTSFTTTAFAPIITSSPIVTPPITLAPALIPTLSPQYRGCESYQ